MALAPYSSFDVPVSAGSRCTSVGGGKRSRRVAAHGITGNHRSWQGARRSGPEVSLVAPDLRGRGLSSKLPGPSACAPTPRTSSRARPPRSSAPCWLGTRWASTSPRQRHRRPRAGGRVVLVDGGVALPLPAGCRTRRMLAGVLGPALARLEMTFATPRTSRLARTTRRSSPGVERGHGGVARPRPDRHRDRSPVVRLARGRAVRRHRSCSWTARCATPSTTSPNPRSCSRRRAGCSTRCRRCSPTSSSTRCEPWPIRLEMLVDNTNHYSILLAPRGAKVVASHLSASLDAVSRAGRPPRACPGASPGGGRRSPAGSISAAMPGKSSSTVLPACGGHRHPDRALRLVLRIGEAAVSKPGASSSLHRSSRPGRAERDEAPAAGSSHVRPPGSAQITIPNGTPHEAGGVGGAKPSSPFRGALHDRDHPPQVR